MGCMTWDEEMVNTAKRAQTDCILKSNADSEHGFVLMPSSDSFLDYPRMWATQDSDFDYETMKCKQSTKECKDFMQAMYYKRGKIGCVKCEGTFSTVICVFEHKVPENELPNRKGTAGTKCEQGEQLSYQKCCNIF
ncbi:Pathogenesis related protein 1a [Trichuris trichiura]|uniref:Pathogenesis related protein 1a n=1 Tax=Trichuris trichiura TaxID=36087 RepID=A0A077ZHJ5_TRITR|nr:Pathogenesis related protein 1a [Trichuris trichiura]